MGKIKLFVLATLFFGQLAFACGSTITGGAGSTQQTNTSSPCSSNTNLGAFGGAPSAPVSTINFGPGYAEAMAAKAKAEECAKEKGNIEREYAVCNSAVSKDKLTETGRCNAYGTSAVSGSVEIRIVNFGGTIENPTYEKCINLVNALAETQKDLCAERKVWQEALARSWNKAQCADFYK